VLEVIGLAALLLARGPAQRRLTVDERTLARFWSMVDPNGPIIRPDLGPCWPWRGTIEKDGYGVITIAKKQVRVHRLSWEIHYGPLGESLALHHCDNRPCVRPVHLFRGTNLDNIRDRDGKGRQAFGERNARYTHPETTARGERSGMAKLTEFEVRSIRVEHARGESYATLGRRYGVSGVLIREVVKRRIWRHVD
jgi:hypothetical protein